MLRQQCDFPHDLGHGNQRPADRGHEAPARSPPRHAGCYEFVNARELAAVRFGFSDFRHGRGSVTVGCACVVDSLTALVLDQG